MSECGTCKEFLPADAFVAHCSRCDVKFHFDCTVISESSWRSLGPDRKAAWRCVPCKEQKARRLKQTQSLSQPSPQAQYTGGEYEGRTDRLEEVLNRFDSFEKKLKDKLEDFEKTLNFYGEKVDDATKTVKALEQKLLTMEKRLDKSESENKELKTRLKNMEVQINEIGQKEFNTKIEITGIKDKNVNAETVAKVILEKAGYEQGTVQHRVEKITKPIENRQEKTSIVMQFKCQATRNEVLGKIKKEKVFMKLNNTVNSDSSYVFINEALSPYYKKLFFEANKVKKGKNYAYLWVKDGRILLKKTAESSTMRLSSMDDLGKI
ncbi:hypothetical protein M8J75_006697 [Diaphorina citri]|nr:hypothetical protein M8J75_006697 [Diaphorina citri]